MKKDFLNVPQHPVSTSLGSIDFPLLYSDVDGVFASFWIDYDRAVNALKNTGLTPALRPMSFSKKAMATIAFFEYRVTTAGAYNEVAVGVFSYPTSMGTGKKISVFDFFKRAEQRLVGTHILELPVTTDWAMAGGVEVYGYPKWVADIPLTFNHTGFKGEVTDAATKEEAFRIEGDYNGFGLTMPSLDIISYSILNNKMLKTAINTDGRFKGFRGKGFRLTAGNSSHHAANTIRELGLDGAEPFLVHKTINFRAILRLGEPIETLS